jgi:hypothetical protein
MCPECALPIFYLSNSLITYSPLRKFPIGIPIGKIPIRIWDKIPIGIFPIGIPIGKIPIGISTGIPIRI